MQMSTLLKLGVMHDHNGTYMEAIGVQYHESKITAQIVETARPELQGNIPSPNPPPSY
jgi:hypothetical protein